MVQIHSSMKYDVDSLLFNPLVDCILLKFEKVIRL